MKLLGHSDIRITLNTYVKIFNEYKTKVAKEVENYYEDLDLTTSINIPLKNTNLNFEDLENKSAKIIQFPKEQLMIIQDNTKRLPKLEVFFRVKIFSIRHFILTKISLLLAIHFPSFTTKA